jgi:hypothetical protein
LPTQPPTFSWKGGNMKKGSKASDEIKLKLSLAHKGKKHSEEHKKKISQSLKGHKVTEKSLAALKTPKIFTDEYRLKMSIAAKKRLENPEELKRLSDINKGNKYNLGRIKTKEEKEKISIKLSGKYRYEKASNWQGGIIIDNRGYVWIKNWEHPSANKSGYITEHKMIMEQHLGRQLDTDEVVHHINGIHNDNRIENLQLVTRAEHIIIHKQKLCEN